MRILLILYFLLMTHVVEARMYQWQEPGVETTQLSGKPPAWYRSSAGGPRVFVFDKGRLIDDTAIEVSDEVRQRMRQRAFILAEEDRQKAKEKMARAQKLKKKYEKADSKDSDKSGSDELLAKEDDVKIVDEEFFSGESEGDGKKSEGIGSKSMDELRKMIADWERYQTESAKQAIE